MRVGVIVVTMLVVTTPSKASQSCMSKTEARQHFGSMHIYWHGPDHCWDATAPGDHQIQARRKALIQEVQRKSDQPKWHNSMSMSEMLSDDEPVQFLRAPTSLVEHHENDDSVTATPWADRWVDIEPFQSPLVVRQVQIVQVTLPPVTKHKLEPMVSPHDVVVLAFIALILTLGTIEALYPRDLHQTRDGRRRRTRQRGHQLTV